MARDIKFHLDENVSNAIANGLRIRRIDVTTTPEKKLIAVPDDVQLKFAISQERVIFTQDIDFLRIHRQGSHIIESEYRDDLPERSLVKILKTGYKNGDKVLRSAEVIVTKSTN